MMTTRRDSYPIAGLGQRLRQARKRAGLTLRDAQDAIGVAYTQLCGYEVGMRTPSLKLLVSLCHAYQVSPNELLGWSTAVQQNNKVVDYDTSFVRRNFRAKE